MCVCGVFQVTEEVEELCTVTLAYDSNGQSPQAEMTFTPIAP